MMKRNRREALKMAQCVQNASAAVRMQTIVKRIALGLALVIGLVALYYSLIPALAGNTSDYIYFDNGLAEFEKVELCYVDASGNYQEIVCEMFPLSNYTDDAAWMPDAHDNINRNTTYVATVTLSDIKAKCQENNWYIQFKGVDSGTVYDTVVNYRVGSASREWGYDYRNFSWKSSPIDAVAMNAEQTCYYAPPKLTQYKYGGTAKLLNMDGSVNTNFNNGEKAQYQFIFEQGEKTKHDGTRVDSIAKPESNTAIIQPNTNENRYFADAVYTMDGELGDVYGLNDLGEKSQSNYNGSNISYEGSVGLTYGQSDNAGSDTYTAYADFYDYYSDWEMAGYPLQNHTISYAYDDEKATITSLAVTVEDNSNVVLQYPFQNSYNDGSSDTPYAPFYVDGGTDIQYSTDANHSGNSGGSVRIGTIKGGSNPYGVFPLADYCEAGGWYTFSFWLCPTEPNGNNQLTFELVGTDENGTEQVIQTLLKGKNIDKTTEAIWYDFSFDFQYPSGYTDVKIRFCNSAGARAIYYDDVVLTYQMGKGLCTQADIPLSGDTLFSNMELYGLTGTISSAEANTVEVVIDYGGGDVRVLQTLTLEAGGTGTIDVHNLQHPIGYTSATIYIRSTSGKQFAYSDVVYSKEYFNLNGTFSEGTNRISYSYQGMLWNSAISTYYEGNSAVYPLYFGSNSWFTGNGRYETEDRHGRTLFVVNDTTDEVSAVYDGTYNGGVWWKSENIHDDRGNANSGHGAYIVPYHRQYLKDLWGFDHGGILNGIADPSYDPEPVKEMNIPMGHSMSRGVPGLVNLGTETVNTNGVDTAVNVISLVGSTDAQKAEDMPYFNSNFILGDNDANAVYGSVYEDVQFKFKFNADTGYYEYDSTDYIYATRVTQNLSAGADEPKYYMQYTGNGVTKGDASDADKDGSSQTKNQFYPFNTINTNDRFATENLMFAMKLDIPFTMYTDPLERSDSIFKFSGDDDVWVYVDDVLALDIGGTHTAVGGFVDLKHGYSVMGSYFDENTGWAEVTNGTIAVKSGYSGQETGITGIEKAAFAILASNDEIGIDPTLCTNSEYGILWTDWLALDKAEFFDDVFVPQSSSTEDGKIKYRYSINGNDTDGYYITVEYKNAKMEGNADGGIEINEDSGGNMQYDYSGTGIVVFKTNPLPQLVQNQGSSDDTVTEGNVTNAGLLLEEHHLNIYYMERGLNSSNFKLAFNFVENTERTVEKEWGDDLDHSNDSVTVELYRTEPTEGMVEETYYEEEPTEVSYSSVLPSDVSFVKIEGAKTDGSYQSGAQFYNTSATAGVRYEKISFQDSSTLLWYEADTYVYMSMNGIYISEKLYYQLYNSNMNLRIYMVYSGDGSGEQIDLDPNPDSATYNASTYMGTDDKGSWIYLPKSYQLRIDFSPVKSLTLAQTDNVYDQYNITAEGWLVEAHAYIKTDVTDTTGATVFSSGSPIDMQGKISRSGLGTVYPPQDQPADAAGRRYGKDKKTEDDISKLLFLITKHTRGYETYYQYNFDVLLVPEGDTVSLSSTVKGGLELKNSNIRYVGTKEGNWAGISTQLGSMVTGNKGYYCLDGVPYNVDVTSTLNSVQEDGEVKKEVTDDVSDPYIGELWVKSYSDYSKDTLLELYVDSRNGSLLYDQMGTYTSGRKKYAAMDARTITRTYATTVLTEKTREVPGVIYTNPKRVGEPVDLNDLTEWMHTWTKITDSKLVGGTSYPYKYFLREVAVSSDHGDIDQYKTEYYDLNGNQINPVQIDDMYLYPLDSGENVTEYIKVVNIPETSVKLTKQWGTFTSSDGSPFTQNVTIDLYCSTDNGQTGEAADPSKVTLTAADLSGTNLWSATISDLPLYENVDGVWKELTYYAAERTEDLQYSHHGELTDYLVSYNTSAVQMSVNGELKTVYCLTGTPVLGMTVTNRPTYSGAFALELLKVSALNNAEKLSGAVFAIEKVEASTVTLLTTAEVQEDGRIYLDSETLGASFTGAGSITLRITETNAPLGYTLMETPIQFTITSDEEKNLSCSTAGATYDSDLVSFTWDGAASLIQITVENEVTPIIIPSTGGTGVSPVYIGGVIFIFTALAGVLLLQKRSERPEK